MGFGTAKDIMEVLKEESPGSKALRGM